MLDMESELVAVCLRTAINEIDTQIAQLLIERHEHAKELGNLGYEVPNLLVQKLEQIVQEATEGK